MHSDSECSQTQGSDVQEAGWATMALRPSPLSPPASGRPVGGQFPPSGAHGLGVKERPALGREILLRAVFSVHIFISFLKREPGAWSSGMVLQACPWPGLDPMLWLSLYCPVLQSPICPRITGFRLEGSWQSSGPNPLRSRWKPD